jgi:hypothetical protein
MWLGLALGDKPQQAWACGGEWRIDRQYLFDLIEF